MNSSAESHEHTMNDSDYYKYKYKEQGPTSKPLNARFRCI